MLKNRYIKLFFTFVPLLILLVISATLAYTSWHQYLKNNTLHHLLQDASQLQKYEKSVLNEILCKALQPKNNKEISKVCEKRTQERLKIEEEILTQKNNIETWVESIRQIGAHFLIYGISDLKKVLGSTEIISGATAYLQKAEYKTDNIEEKELIQIYAHLSNHIYATHLETLLVTYYVSTHQRVSMKNTIFWDKIIEASYPIDIKKIKYLPSVKEKLLTLSKNKKYHEILSHIDDMRIEILTGQSPKGKLKWIELLENKQTILQEFSSVITTELQQRAADKSFRQLAAFVAYLLTLIIATFAFIYTYITYRHSSKHNKALVDLVHRIQALDSYSNALSSKLEPMLEDAKDRVDVYAYIYEYFQALDERCKKSEAEAKAKSEFISTLSHEIRTPLNGIIGFSELLKNMGVTPDQEEFLSLIEGSSHNLIAIVNDILKLSKINADKMELENVSFNLFEVVESTVATFTQKAIQKDIEFSLFIDPFITYYLQGDAIKLSQVLTNLVGNAIKFTNPYGKINIFVQSMHHDENTAQIKFAVIDDGIGLSPEQIEKIFHPFTQANQNTDSKYGGTGLGLSISRKMVELMGGELKVESEPNQGSKFHFTLTLKKDKEHQIPDYPNFEDVTVGLALPVRSIRRQMDTNLQIYLNHLGAKFTLYYYEDLFEHKNPITLPDIMVFDHHYARLPGELEQCSALPCKTVILTNATLYTRINPLKHHFNDVIFTPITVKKAIRILENIQTDEQKSYKQPSLALESVDSFAGLHALIVDDNIINRKLIKIILEKIGLRVSMATNGKEAVEKYKERQYDIVFMDIQMPVMDGVAATKAILSYEKDHHLTHTPIIALTANIATGNREYYLSQGLDDYATKPLEIDVLKHLIATHCNKASKSEDKEK